MEVNLKALVDRLDPAMHQALDQAVWMCRSMTHYDVELEHLLLKVLEAEDAGLDALLRELNVDRSRLIADLTRAAESLRKGNTRETPGLSPRIPELFTSAWLHASVDLGVGQIGAASTFYALLTDASLASVGREISNELRRIDGTQLEKAVQALPRPAAAPGDGAAAPAAPRTGGGSLDRFTQDLTHEAREGKLDGIVGRDGEVRQMVDILMRRRQNNPILTGEPGVGKTAVVEGLAVRIASDDVPAPLRGVRLLSLDLAALQAGAGVRGEFEDRLKGVIEEVKESATPIVLFIDEAHSLVGAGGSEGQSDAANLLKPALARGDLRTIAATTWSEYKKYFEKDAALARRFQVVSVPEPSEDVAIEMMRACTGAMEAHHQVEIAPDAIDAAVRLSHRYLAERQLPDKSVSVLDTACARVAIGQQSIPADLEDARQRLKSLEVERGALAREASAGADHGERLQQIEQDAADTTARVQELEQRWEQERTLVRSILGLRKDLAQGADASADQDASLLEKLQKQEGELVALQGEAPLMTARVDDRVVASVIADWTGIPVGRMVADEIQTVLELDQRLSERVVGQDDGLEAIARRIQTSRAQLDDPDRPVGVFLLVGPSGVGKTETALSLAELLYGGERNLITINMSEYQEAHTVAGLKGSPPGYVGYGEGGVLTEAVRRRPYSVVLLDEVEKAHPDVMELFYQVFDKGTLEDGEGRRIDFRNTVLLLTSNLGTDLVEDLCRGKANPPGTEELQAALHPELTAHFKPALVGRMVVVPYRPLEPDVLRKIIDLKMAKVRRRLQERHGVELVLQEDVIPALLASCTETASGARNIDRVITGSILPEASRRLLQGMAEGRSYSRLTVSVAATGGFDYALEGEDQA